MPKCTEEGDGSARWLPVFNAQGVRLLQEVEAKDEALEEVLAPEPHAAHGCGAAYEVLAERVALRRGPSTAAKPLGQLRRGEDVELFGWDTSRLWRYCVDHRLSRSGWVLLDHVDLGPLLRPLGALLCVRPLNPLVVAAAEGRLEDLEAFLSSDEWSFEDPRGLALAVAERGSLRGTARLLLAGAPGGTETTRRLRRLSLEELSTSSEEELSSRLRDMEKEEREKEKEKVTTVVTAHEHGEEVATVEQEKDVEEQVSEASPMTYEVCYSAVWIRREPHSEAAQLSKRIQGQRLEILHLDATQRWGKVIFKTSEGLESGWMLLRHPDLGELLKPIQHNVRAG